MRRTLLASIVVAAAATTLTAGSFAVAEDPPAGAREPLPAPGRAAGTEPPGPVALRRLILLVDGVPFAVVDSLQRGGHFRGFRAAGAVVSPFPSLTGVGFQDIWQEPPPPGYEDRYFDAHENRMAGGLLEHILKGSTEVGFHRHVEVEPHPLTGGLTYIAPRLFAEPELDALRQEVEERALWDSTIVAYIVSTDALGHREGRPAMADLLVQIDTLVEGFRARYGPGLRVDVISDHGNDLVPTRSAPLEDALLAAGLLSVEHLEAPGDVVLPRFGLVGAAFGFSSAEDGPRLAEALAGAPGVELVARSLGDRTVEVLGRGGRALLQGDPAGIRYRYLPVEGDPLGLAAALTELQKQGAADAQGWALDAAWLAASHGTPFLDGVRRLVEGLDDAVIHEATVVVSLAPGWHWGDAGVERLVNLNGTHGSLRTSSSLGVVMSTHLAAPPLLRADRVAAFLGLRP